MQNLNFHDIYANAHAIFSHFFPLSCQLSTTVLILSPQYLMSGSAECLPIDPCYFTGYFRLFIATIQGFRHCLTHTFNWITSFEFCRHVMNTLMQALTHMDPNCLKAWAYCWSKLTTHFTTSEKNIYQYLILTTGLGFSPATCYPLRYQNVNGVIMPENM